MAEFGWTSTPTGVFQNHAISNTLRRQAVGDTKFMRHVRPEPGFGPGMGDTMTMTRIRQLGVPTSPFLDEHERIPEDTMSMNSVNVTVREMGRAISVTKFGQVLSKFDLHEAAQELMREQLKQYLDIAAATEFKVTQIKYVPTGVATNNIATDGTAAVSATSNMTVWHVEEIKRYLYDTLAAPPAVDDDYIGIFRFGGLLGLRRDTAWQTWHQYTDPRAKYNGETGRLEGIRFVETNNFAALGMIGTNDVLGEGVVFGADAVRIIEARTPELLAKPDTDDFGRRWAVAWYGILNFKSVWGDSANRGEARIVHVTSSD